MTKILCPTDFSKPSLNAINWALNYVQTIEKGEVEILHCLDYPNIIDPSQKIGKMVAERAKQNVQILAENLRETFKSIHISTSVYRANPKEFIVERAAQIKADLIVLGATGFSSLKDITVGSVTEYLISNGRFPIISIPYLYLFKPIKKIVLGVDEKELKHPDTIDSLYQIVAPFGGHVFLTQSSPQGEIMIEYDYHIDDHLKDLSYSDCRIPKEGNIAETIAQFAHEEEADLLCMVHHKRNWFSSLFHHSVTKDAIFEAKIPLLILPD